jgi:serine/threonine-protein kinase
MGVVYRARQVGLDRLVALKVVLAGAQASPAEMARFRREAEAIARLGHPNVIHIYEAGEHNGLPYFSMELCSGGSLATKLAARPLPPREAASLTATLARGVHAAHTAGVVHRDLKPANILLQMQNVECRRQNEKPDPAFCILHSAFCIPKITDFGLARKLEGGNTVTASGAILGTPSYMAPEQAGDKAKEAGPAADTYALGAILYECLTGQPPFKAATPLDTIVQVLADPPVPPSRLRSRIPPALEAICLKCLEKDPRHRYPSAAALADNLDAFLAGHKEPDRRQKPRNPFRFLNRLSKRREVLPAALVLLVAALSCLWMGFAIPERMPRAEFPNGAVVCLSPDGSRLLVADGREANLHDTHSGKLLATYHCADGFTAAAYAPDGDTLALGERGGETELWDLKTSQSRARFRTHEGPVGTLIFGPHGAVFVARAKPDDKTGAIEAVRCWEQGRLGPVLAVTVQLTPD